MEELLNVQFKENFSNKIFLSSKHSLYMYLPNLHVVLFCSGSEIDAHMKIQKNEMYFNEMSVPAK